MKPYSHQIEVSEQGLAILREHGLVYLAMEERTGKTLASILICEQADVKNILVITKKAALKGWEDTLNSYKCKKNYRVINYHRAKDCTLDADIVILDEAHNYVSSYPKKSQMWSWVKKLTTAKPIIYLSATPYAQGYQLLYHQFALSTWSPWKIHKNFYEWFRMYGIPEVLYLGGRQVNNYNKVKPETFNVVKHLFITKKRSELGFEHEPEDVPHYITLSDETKDRYNTLTISRVLDLDSHTIVCDTVMKLRMSLHQLEGGTIKIDDNISVLLKNKEKIDYILENWGDTDEIVIMYNYVHEKVKLQQHFKNAEILQATSYAEGIDLSHKKHLIIYSQDFSTARHTQRRARQANKKREHPIDVHFLLVKKAISDQVYQTVSINKRNYIDSLYTGELL